MYKNIAEIMQFDFDRFFIFCQNYNRFLASHSHSYYRILNLP